jgi:hypothetical protein
MKNNKVQCVISLKTFDFKERERLGEAEPFGSIQVTIG